MGNKTVAAQSSVTPLFLLFIVFLVLKLTNVINWSWWWITAPLRIPVAIVVGIMIIMLFVYGIIGIVETFKN